MFRLRSLLRRTMSTTTGHSHLAFAQETFSKSGASGLYDRARPSYPARAVEKILSQVPPQASIVELGAGTGIFSRLILARAKEFNVSKLISLEPSDGMREGWENALAKQPELAKNVDSAAIDFGLFAETKQPDASADLVTAAQAFHWVGLESAQAFEEFVRILKPDGTVGLIWNLEDRDVPWIGQLRDAYEKYEVDTPQYRLGLWRNIFESEVYKTKFHPVEHTAYEQTLVGTVQGVIDRALSKSFITHLPEEEQTKLSKELAAIVEKGDGKVWIDEAAGTFEYKYKTDVFIFKRK